MLQTCKLKNFIKNFDEIKKNFINKFRGNLVYYDIENAYYRIRSLFSKELAEIKNGMDF